LLEFGRFREEEEARPQATVQGGADRQEVQFRSKHLT
jgi:hypothetical protein